MVPTSLPTVKNSPTNSPKVLGANQSQVAAAPIQVASSLDLMKNLTIRQKPRSKAAALGNIAKITRDKRRLLSDKDRNRLITEIETGLPQKFSTVDLNRLQSEDAFQLSHTSSLAQQLTAIADHLARYDLLHILNMCPLLNFDETDPIRYADQGKQINLLEAYDNFTVENSCDTVTWMREYLADEEILDELTWTHNFLLNCCESDNGDGSLYNAVSSEIDRLRKENSSCIGGPVTFMVILSNIISSSNEALKLLESKLEILKITNFRGENVSTLTTQLTHVINRLEQTKVPKDLVQSLLKVFQTSSNAAFNDAFKSLANAIRLKMITPIPTWQVVFLRGKEIYTEELNSGRWNVAAEGSTESIFKAAPGKVSGGLKCKHCGGNHIAPNCPHRQNDPSDSGSKPDRDPITRRPSRTLGDTCKTVTLEGGKKVNAWSCKDANGKILKWCGRCRWNDDKGRWTDGTRAHFTHEHRGWSPSANVASNTGPSSGTTQSTTTDAPPANPAGPPSEPSRTVSFSSSLSSYAAAARGAAEE